jgi:cytochrome c biogenesis protein CcmG, thiol:disulfide interchange protein DsbE
MDEVQVARRRMPVLPWWTIPALLAAIAVVGLLAYGLVSRQRGRPTEGPAPDFTVQTFDGQTLQLSEYRGTPVIVNFWASWCVPCRTEMPLLESTWRKYQGQVLFIGIDHVDTEPAARAFLEEFNVTYPNGPDLGGRVSDAYRIRGVPETFFIDREGNLRGVKIGPLSEAELEGWIQQLRQ